MLLGAPTLRGHHLNLGAISFTEIIKYKLQRHIAQHRNIANICINIIWVQCWITMMWITIEYCSVYFNREKRWKPPNYAHALATSALEACRKCLAPVNIKCSVLSDPRDHVNGSLRSSAWPAGNLNGHLFLNGFTMGLETRGHVMKRLCSHQ